MLLSQQEKSVDNRVSSLEQTNGVLSDPYPVDPVAFQQIELHNHWTSCVPHLDVHPTSVAQDALAQWNRYLATKNETYARAFLQQASLLVQCEVRIGKDAGGWPLAFLDPEASTSGSWLSALMQGIGLSVLVRAYHFTQNHLFLECAQRVVRTFERDILDGGVCAPFEQDGVCFEEVAIYPASHALSGFLFALCGLYDYLKLTGERQIEPRLQCGLATFHHLLEEFDASFWIYSDLLQRRLASPVQFALNIQLLEALAMYSGCVHCSSVALRWKGYYHRRDNRIRYWLACRTTRFGQAFRRLFQPQRQPLGPLRVCVALPAFPAPGGIQTFVEKIAQVMQDDWQIEYLTQHRGPNSEKYRLHCFGTRRMTPWYFPFIWLYVISGFRKLVLLILHGAGYDLILAQDSLFTGAFATLAAKLTGRRVVCIDHGDLSLLIAHNHRRYRSERLREVMTKPWPMPVRFCARLLLSFYWPSRWLLARITARLVDHYLIPGVAEDGVNAICRQLGVRRSCITRFSNMIDIRQHTMPDAAMRASFRERLGLATDAVVVAIVCRLAAEKGLEIALEALHQAIAACSSACPEIRVMIVGDGPLRGQVERDIRQYGLSEVCQLWGELPIQEVVAVLGISDIFLYTSWRGAGYPLAIMEAMASECAVIASTEPIANASLLGEGRGITVPPGDVPQTSHALMRLLQDRELCQTMGQRARSYIAQYHSPALFKQTLQRATAWSALDDFLSPEERI